MPLLLRRFAPSPSVDELSLSVPAAPISTSLNDCGRSSGHARCSLRRRRRSTNSTTTSELSTRESADDMLGDNQSMLDADDLRRSSKTSSEFPEGEEDEEADAEQNVDVDAGACSTTSARTMGTSRARRVSSSARSHMSCACSEDGMAVAASHRSASESALTSTTVVFKENQLAVLDVEIGKMRRGLARKVYSRICTMSRSLYRRKANQKASKPQLTN